MASDFIGDVWVGTSLGVLKGLSVSNKQTLSFLPAGFPLEKCDRTREVMSMSWEHKSKERFYVGLRNGKVLLFDCQRNYFAAETDLGGGGGCGHFVGIAKHSHNLITCNDKGIISIWPDSQEKKSEISVGGPVDVMSASPEVDLMMATGGKNNDLKLWDGNRPDALPIFKAKNVPHDYLNLQVPVWVTSIGFVPDTGERPCIAVGTGYHHLRLYDTRGKRRPVYSKLWEEAPITCLDVSSDGRYYLVGNSHGKIARIDIRKGTVLNRYHGFGGSVTSISSWSGEDDNVFAACGLDRYLRVYRTEPPQIIHKAYMKLICNQVLMSGLHTSSDKEDIDEEEQDGKERIRVGKKRKRGKVSEDADASSTDDSENELWEGMEQVVTSNNKRKSKHKIN